MSENNDISVFDEPLFKDVGCNDGAKRSIGRVRLTVDIVKEIETDYPFDVLPNESMSSSGYNTFNLSEYGVISHELDLPHQEGMYPWHTMWITLPVEQVGVEDSYGDTVLYAPEEDIYCGLVGSNRDVEFWTESGETIHKCEYEDVGFFEIPDEVLVEVLPEKYNSKLTSQSI